MYMAGFFQLLNLLVLVLIIYVIYVIAFKVPKIIESMDERLGRLEKLISEQNKKN
ncbi:hypothetical protein [Alkaliphilus crotonatoxidans]